ncbi:DUF4402 domain-containing protein [Flagellimonas halotolerans]|uniref:DUF4402 domain-containing protein n=1 Tax=Flagellimonas halotolerans TaxID=3112164 RepID=A0ABU6ISF1_9FLAO|nr:MULTISPECIES: DUF4402 domain-containing protein [unclassified Allomuricauda]MEC3966257.1 DUF4402 domain-containing protein [Muricauda sp. SYSU M86414]MEC4266057.1 DUF4402 domain-containing protein [Muricauda sp. SYSU M84420]
MKKVVYFIMFAVVGSFSGLYAQESATATATATVVAPIAITKSADMNFGNVAVSASTSGTVVLAPGGTRTVTGGATIPATTGTVNAAAFNITGEAGYTYSITLPSSITLNDGGVNTMTVDTFTSTPSGTGTLTAGAETVNVGATLNLAAAQASGTYSNTSDLTVTVNYN